MSYLSQIVYPVLCLSRDNSVVVYRDADTLDRCNALALWGTRYYDGLKIVDGRGELFTVAGAEPVPPISGLRRSLARLLNRPLRVSLELRGEGPLSLTRAKELVTEWLQRDPELWESTEDLDVWKARVAASEGVEDLIGVFAD